MRRVTKISKQDGQVQEREKLLKWFNHYLDSIPDGEQLITFEPTNRTDAQNKYYWVVLSQLSRALGESKDRLHEYFRGEYLPQEDYFTLIRKKRMESTTQADTDEFGQYLDKIIQTAAEQGIYIPDIEEYKHQLRQ